MIDNYRMKKAFPDKQKISIMHYLDGVLTGSSIAKKFVLTNDGGKTLYVRCITSSRYAEVMPKDDYFIHEVRAYKGKAYNINEVLGQLKTKLEKNN